MADWKTCKYKYSQACHDGDVSIELEPTARNHKECTINETRICPHGKAVPDFF